MKLFKHGDLVVLPKGSEIFTLRSVTKLPMVGVVAGFDQRLKNNPSAFSTAVKFDDWHEGESCLGYGNTYDCGDSGAWVKSEDLRLVKPPDQFRVGQKVMRRNPRMTGRIILADPLNLEVLVEAIDDPKDLAGSYPWSSTGKGWITSNKYCEMYVLLSEEEEESHDREHVFTLATTANLGTQVCSKPIYKKKGFMGVLKYIAKRSFDNDTKTLIKAGYFTQGLELTTKGTEAALAILVAGEWKTSSEFKKELVEQAKSDLEEAKEADKHCD